MQEHFDHDDCPECGGPSTPAEGVPDQMLRGCAECGEVWCEDLSEPVRKALPGREFYNAIEATADLYVLFWDDKKKAELLVKFLKETRANFKQFVNFLDGEAVRESVSARIDEDS
jgi:hypothetical protein